MTQPSTTTPAPQRDLLVVHNLKKYFPVRSGLLQRVIAQVKAVDDVSFSIREGETFSLVGESGSGKTTVGRTVLRLIPPTAGGVTFQNQDVFAATGSHMKRLRRDMQIIFQDPYSSLDPRMPIGQSIAEGLVAHGIGTTREREQTVRSVLAEVGLHSSHARRYPHEFSGGQRQRIGIARALALRPKFMVLDEPVSALDVSIQSQVLNILRDLQRQYRLTYLFVAHNLSVVEHISDRVGVMYLGKMMEMSERRELFANPLHPYTRALMSAIPIPDPTIKRERIILKGDIPSPLKPPSGCVFHTRCPIAQKGLCDTQVPTFRNVGRTREHLVACHLVADDAGG